MSDLHDEPIVTSHRVHIERATRATEARWKAQKAGTTRRGHPTTSDQDYSQKRVRYFMAIDAWKRRTGRLFPTFDELLDIAEECGWSNETQEWEPTARDKDEPQKKAG